MRGLHNLPGGNIPPEFYYQETNPMEGAVTEHDQGQSPVSQEMARLVYERLGAIEATQRLHGEAIGSLLTRMDTLETKVDTGFAQLNGRMDTLTQQMQTNHEGVMAVLAELVGKKT